MKLKVFNKETCASTRDQAASIRINQKGGLLGFNKAAVQQMGLKKDDQVAIYQDEESPEDWYLEVVKTKGFFLRQKSEEDPSLYFNNTTLCKEIAKSVSYKENCGSLLIAGQPTKIKDRIFWGLLTVSLRKK